MNRKEVGRNSEYFEVMRTYDGVSRAVLRDLDERFGVDFQLRAILDDTYLKTISSKNRVIRLSGFEIDDNGYAIANLQFAGQPIKYKYEIFGAECVEFRGDNILKKVSESDVGLETAILEPVV